MHTARTLSLGLLSTVLLGACNPDSGPMAPAPASPELLSAPFHDSFREPIDFVGFEDCVGEPVRITGQAHVTINLVTATETQSNQHTVFMVNVNGTGVGQVTGRTYRYHEAQRSVFESPTAEALHGILNDHIVVRLVSQGSAPNAVIRVAFHFIFTGQGVPKL
ncbi:MAG TPA: hypothetical protein VMY76_03755, partial [Gemmatimonadales bacterium]|nr:hypothetical protein [Gemmatimonadales bacterium]